MWANFIIRKFLKNRLIIRRQLCLPNKISGTSASESAIELRELADVVRVEMGEDEGGATFRQIAEAGTRGRGRGKAEEREGGTHLIDRRMKCGNLRGENGLDVDEVEFIAR